MPGENQKGKLLFLPEPRRVIPREGSCTLRAPLRLVISPDHPPDVVEVCYCMLRRFAAIGNPATVHSFKPGTIRHVYGTLVEIGFKPRRNQGYDLTVDTDHIIIRAAGPAGTRHALWTLWQMLYQCQRSIPCVEIRDRPALAVRGFLLDVSRGRIPRLHRLAQYVTKLSALKFNMFQLYVEHVYDFLTVPGVPDTPSCFSSPEILRLGRLCSREGITLVPCLALLGHMGRILSLPRFRRLAERPPATSWARMTWPQRLRGATLCPPLRESRQLAARLLEEYAGLHPAPYFNACCDEPYDLGRKRIPGRRRDPVGEFGRYVRYLDGICRPLGKRLMIWGDFPARHPGTLADLPEDVIILDWGYEPVMHFAKFTRFVRSGFSTVVCPSLRGYRRVFHDVSASAANVRGYVGEAARNGAMGLLVTEWGDMGHFNMLPSGYYGLALAAALSWNPATRQDYFEKAFNLFFGGTHQGELGRLYRRAESVLPSWPWDPELTSTPGEVPSAVRIGPEDAFAWADRIEAYAEGPLMDDQDRDELSLACSAAGITAALHTLRNVAPGRSGLPRRLAGVIRDFRDRYREVWLRAYYPHRLEDIDRVLRSCGTPATRS